MDVLIVSVVVCYFKFDLEANRLYVVKPLCLVTLETAPSRPTPTLGVTISTCNGMS